MLFLPSFWTCQNTASRKVPGRKTGVSRKVNWKGFWGFCVFLDIYCLSQGSLEQPRAPKSRGLQNQKIIYHPPRKLPGRVSGRKTAKHMKIGARAHLEGSDSVFFVPFPTQKSNQIRTYFKTPQSRKVPGRKTGVSRKLNWKGQFKQCSDVRINFNPHIYIYILSLIHISEPTRPY